MPTYTNKAKDKQRTKARKQARALKNGTAK